MEFEWDLKKEIENISKHGVTFEEAIESFTDPWGIQLLDSPHSKGIEQRFYWIGKSIKGDILTTRFTKRSNKIRIFGCANWRKFRKIYNERTQT